MLGNKVYDFYSRFFGYLGLNYQEVTVLFILFVGFLIVTFLIILGIYILNSVSYFKLAKITNIRYRAIAFIPILNGYLVGKISDNINEKSGIRKYRAVKMLVMNAAITILNMLNGYLVISLFMRYNELINNGYYATEEFTSKSIEFVATYIPQISILIVFSVISFTLCILYFLTYIFAHNVVYKEFAPKYQIVYTTLTVIAPFLGVTFLPAIFILFIVNKIENKRGNGNIIDKDIISLDDDEQKLDDYIGNLKDTTVEDEYEDYFDGIDNDLNSKIDDIDYQLPDYKDDID